MAKKRGNKKEVPAKNKMSGTVALIGSSPGSFIEASLIILGFNNIVFKLNPKGRIDLFIINFDMSIPEGLEVIEKVRERKKTAKIICISGDSNKGMVAITEGCRFLKRPFSIDELKEEIGKA